jgi:hypothetical protein
MLGLLPNRNFVACVLWTRNFLDSGLTLARIQEEGGVKRGGLRLFQRSTERLEKDKEMTISPANKRFLMKCKEWLYTSEANIF